MWINNNDINDVADYFIRNQILGKQLLKWRHSRNQLKITLDSGPSFTHRKPNLIWKYQDRAVKTYSILLVSTSRTHQINTVSFDK